MNNTQLTDPSGFDVSRMIFSKVETKQIPNDDPSAPKMTYKTVRLGVKNADGSKGDLVFGTPQVFSFGLSENTEMGSQRVNGYTVPLCLHNKDGPSDEELAFVDAFNRAIDHIKKHVLDTKDEMEKYDLEESDLKRLNPLYYRREKGKIVEGTGPTLYAKVLFKKGSDGGKILTDFTHIDTEEPLDPLTLLKKYCYVTGAVKFESIYIGTKISVQIKLSEALVKPLDAGPKKLLARPKSHVAVTKTEHVADALAGDSDSSDSDGDDDGDDDDEGGGSLAGSDAEEAPVKPATPPPKTVKRVVRKKANQ